MATAAEVAAVKKYPGKHDKKTVEELQVAAPVFVPQGAQYPRYK